MSKTIVELENLEKALKGEEIDLRLAREYRDAMDYISSITGSEHSSPTVPTIGSCFALSPQTECGERRVSAKM